MILDSLSMDEVILINTVINIAHVEHFLLSAKSKAIKTIIIFKKTIFKIKCSLDSSNQYAATESIKALNK